MSTMQIKSALTSPERVVFALMAAGAMGLLGSIALWRPEQLRHAAAVCGAATVISLAFNREEPWRRQLWGFVFASALAAAGYADAIRVPRLGMAGAVWAAGAAVAIGAAGSPAFGLRVYRGWMLAAAPIGWTVSRVVLAAVFFGVMMPIGLVMRAMGRDPMMRRFNRTATSYWSAHRPRSDPAEYFRQY